MEYIIGTCRLADYKSCLLTQINKTLVQQYVFGFPSPGTMLA